MLRNAQFRSLPTYSPQISPLELQSLIHHPDESPLDGSNPDTLATKHDDNAAPVALRSPDPHIEETQSVNEDHEASANAMQSLEIDRRSESRVPTDHSSTMSHNSMHVLGFPSRHTMRGSFLEIGFASLLMSIVSIVLIGLTYANLEPRNQVPAFPDTVTVDCRKQPLDSDAYYVNYSATRLAFISSLSSTVALVLVPLGMNVSSYLTASSLQKASSTRGLSRLPSPYQLELLIPIIGDNSLELYRYFQHKFTAKNRAFRAVPLLNYAACTLASLLGLAAAITIIDALFHNFTHAVQCNKSAPYVGSDFNPGRSLSNHCLSQPDQFTRSACNIELGGSGGGPFLLGRTEAYLTFANASTNNTIQLTDDGKTAILTHPRPPPNLSYSAHSYASATTCEMITGRCNIHYNGGFAEAESEWGYDCTTASAGLYLTGSLTDMDVGGAGGGVTSTFYTSPSKSPDTNDTVFIGNSSADHGRIYLAMLFVLPQGGGNASVLLPDRRTFYDPELDLITSTYGPTYGIMSCNTGLSDVVYTATSAGTLHAPSLTGMDNTASRPFFQAFTFNFGRDNIAAAVSLAVASATHKKDITDQIARSYDRTILGLTAGMLDAQEAISQIQKGAKQLTQVPVSYFVVLVVLNLVLAATGLALASWAFMLSKTSSVGDVQARLGIGAMVAALFED